MRIKLASTDKNFWAMDTETNQQVIASLCPLDRTPSFARIQEIFREQLPRFPKLTQRVENEYWVTDTTFDLEQHLSYRFAPEMQNDHDLLQEAAAVFSKRLDHQRPLWSFTLISNQRQISAPELEKLQSKDLETTRNPSPSPDICCFLFKIHHAVADGLGGLEFVHSLCDAEHASGELQASGAKSNGPARVRNVALPRNSQIDLWKSVKRAFAEAFEGRSRFGISGKNSAQRKIAICELPLLELKRMKHHFRVSLNELLLTLVTDSVRSYAHTHHLACEDAKVVMPVNLRKAADRLALGNQFTGIGVPLPTRLRDPLKQLEQVKETLIRIKEDGSLGAYRWVGNCTALLPHRLRRRLTAAMGRRTSFICTNMPGPHHVMTIAGAKILGNYGCAALLENHAIAFGFISYAKKVCAVLVSDATLVPNPKEILAHFETTLNELRAHLPPKSTEFKAVQTVGE